MSKKNLQNIPDLQFSFSSGLNPGVKVLGFSGQTSVTMESVEKFPVDGLTVSCWIKSGDSQPGAVLFSYGAKPGDNTRRLWLKNPANLEIGFGDSGTGPTGVIVNDNRWHHIAFTLRPPDSTHYGAALFKDGVSMFQGIGAIPHPLDEHLETHGKLELGHGIGDEKGFTGQISEFRLWNGVRSENEIITDMQVRMGDSTAGIVIYWALESAQTSGTVTAGQFVDSGLRFRTVQLLAKWNEITGAVYELEVDEVDGCWTYKKSNLTTLEEVVNGYFINKTYRAKARAVISGTPGEWSTPQTVTVLNLQQVCPGIIQPEPQSVAADWLPPDQARSYNIALYENGGTTPQVTNQAGTRYDLTALAKGNDYWQFRIRAVSEGSLGPASDVDALQPIGLTFKFIDDGTGAPCFKLDWTNSQPDLDFYLVQIFKDNTEGTPIFESFFDKSTTSYRKDNPDVSENDRYLARVRGISTGTLGAWSEAVLTIHRIVAPKITSASGEGAGHSVTVAWTFKDVSVTNVSYNVELWNGDKSRRLLNSSTPNKTYTFVDPVIEDEKTYNVRVQAQADSSLGRWSEYEQVPIGVPHSVTNVQIKATAEAGLTVSWDSSETGATYKATIFIDGTEKRTHDNITGTSTGFSKDETGVSTGNTYDVTVEIWTKKDGKTSEPTIKEENIKIEPIPNGHSPEVDDPINAATGSYSYSHLDIGVNGVEPLLFVIYYHTYTPTPDESGMYDGKPLGNRWNHSYNTKLVRAPGGEEISVLWGDGHVHTYAVPASITGNYPPLDAPRGDRLVLGMDGYFVLTKKNRYRYRFTPEGRLKEMISPIGNVVSLNYQNNRLTNVQLDGSHYLTLQYHDGGLIKSVTDHSGRSVGYTYENNNLATVTDVMGNNRTFEYADKSLVHAVTDENGHTFIKNRYDDLNRVVFQQDARAVAGHEDYGSTLAYSTITEDNLEIIIADYNDRAGNTTRFKSYKSSSNMKEAVYRLGDGKTRRVHRTYDGFGNILTETVYEGLESGYEPGKGNTTIYTYDGNNNRLTETGPLGQVITRTYDAGNNLLTETDKIGNTRTFHYEGNRLKKITDFLGRDMVFEYYDGPLKGLVKTIADVNGNTFSFRFENGYLVEVTNPLGEKTTFSNDGLGRVTGEEIRDKQGNILKTTTGEYDAAGNLTGKSVFLQNQPRENAFTYRYEYDNTGNLTGVTGPDNHTVTYRYDPNDLLKKVIYPAFAGLNRQTQYDYDKIDHLQRAAYSQGVVEQFTYDRFNRLSGYVDANAQIYGFDYESLFGGNGTYSEKAVKTFPGLSPSPGTVYSAAETYDAAGRLTAMENRADNTVTITYDREETSQTGIFQQVVTYTLPPAEQGAAPHTIRDIFDAVGRPVSFKNEADKVTTITYSLQTDPDTGTNQQVITKTDPPGNREILVRDALGRLVGYRKGNDDVMKESTFQYDALGRLTAAGEKHADGFVYTRYTYRFDPQTNHIKVSIGKPGDDQALSFLEFNGLEQLVKETDQLGHSMEKTYTPWGGLHTYTNARQQTLTFGYDGAGRFNKITLPGEGGDIIHQLDGNGNRLETQLSGQTVIRRTFDHWDRLISRENTAHQKIQYDYTPVDQVKTLTYSDNKQVGYRYDNLYRLKDVSDWNNRVTRYRYDPTGNITAVTYPDNSTASLEFDDSGRFLGIEHHSGGFIIAKIHYELDAVGNRVSARAVYPLPPVIPSSDTVNFTYNAANQAETFNGQPLSYDQDGNPGALPVNGRMKRLQYDEFNRVTALGSDSYAYDADGLRTSATINGVQRKFVHDIDHYQSPMLEMADPARCVTGTYIQETIGGAPGIAELQGQAEAFIPLADSLDRILEMTDAHNNILYRYVYGNGLISREGADGDYHVYHCDSRGTTLALTGENGGITDKYAYDASGKIANRQGNTVNPFLYTGQYGVVDDGNGLLYMRARSYSPELMRFLQKDFLMGSPYFPQTLNRYAYVYGNPISLIDPLGLSGAKDAFIGMGIGMGIGIAAVAALAFCAATPGCLKALGTIAGSVVGGIAGGVVGGVLGPFAGEGLLGGVAVGAGAWGTSVGAAVGGWGTALEGFLGLTAISTPTLTRWFGLIAITGVGVLVILGLGSELFRKYPVNINKRYETDEL
jgi:RHS repeat-associated protein